MRLSVCLLLLALSAIGICAQQPAPSSQPPEPSGPGQLPPCPAKWDFHPEIDGIYRVADVKPPKATHSLDATFSDEARLLIKKQHIKNFEAVSLVGITVGADGKPRDLCLMKAAGFGLDKQAFQAVEQFRFKPATRDGMLVAVRLSIEMNFRLY
jgi:TonB family protein